MSATTSTYSPPLDPPTSDTLPPVATVALAPGASVTVVGVLGVTGGTGTTGLVGVVVPTSDEPHAAKTQLATRTLGANAVRSNRMYVPGIRRSWAARAAIRSLYPKRVPWVHPQDAAGQE